MKFAPIIRTLCSYHPQHARQPNLSSVVEIFTVKRESDPLYPWASTVATRSGGSGFVISDRRILTNAHVVTGATLIEVKKPNSGTMFKAKIKVFGHACDLAMLEIDDKTFWEELVPLEIMEVLPNISQPVTIVGYPIGGDGMCLTTGIVSRIDSEPYLHSKTGLHLPRLQVDGAINPGTSGGPVFVEDKVVGVAFQKSDSGDNIGFVIPSPIVKLFLDNIGDGFCTLGVSTQPMHNPMLRSFFGMNSTTTGILINRVRRLVTQVPLRQHDILMEVDGKAIRNDGKVLLDNGIPLQLDGFIALKKPGELASLKILRNKDCIVCQSELFVDGWSKTDYASPTYLILGGLVLTEHNFAGVVISQVLEDQINVGYTHLENAEVTRVNEVDVECMGHVCEVLAAKPRFVRLELECGETVVVDMSWHKRRYEKILKQHSVMNGMSKDVEEFFASLQ